MATKDSEPSSKIGKGGGWIRTTDPEYGETLEKIRQATWSEANKGMEEANKVLKDLIDYSRANYHDDDE